MDDLIQDRVTQKENELNAEYDERMRNYEERWVPVPDGVLTHQRKGPPAPGADSQGPAPRLAHLEREHSGQAPRRQPAPGLVIGLLSMNYG